MNAEAAESKRAMHAIRVRDHLFVLMFSIALFGSALLMFSIQPVVGKLLLPKLGGSPQVWNTCMVFFQAMLFAGYLHVHYTGKWLGPRVQAAIHLALVLAALLTLPIGLSGVSELSDMSHPVLWLMQTLFLAIGAPMFIVSSTAPLLQKWFSHTNHPTAQDPYFLYVASNLGSLLALLSYPTLVEPFLDLGQQARLISGGFVALVVALVICALLFYRNYAAQPPAPQASTLSTENESVTGQQRLRWLLLSFAPSSLLLGVTTYITTDIASAPLLWIVPLALYLMTFVIVFARQPPIPHKSAIRMQVFLTIGLSVLVLIKDLITGWPLLVIHLFAFFATALMCHGELVRSRPDASHLTEFYLWLSFGGVLGGAFNALLAPIIFVQPFEYPLMLAVAAMLRPNLHPLPLHQGQRRAPLVIVLIFALLLLRLVANMSGDFSTWVPMAIAWAIAGLAGFGLLHFGKRPIWVHLTSAAALAIIFLLPRMSGVEPSDEGGTISRNFFGVYRVYYDRPRDMNIFMHGTTVHGAQSRNPTLATQPTSYYYASGPFGDMFRALSDKLQNGKVAVLGLGAGGLTCYGATKSEWTYYEISPIVEQIAREPRYFTYLRDCPPKVNVVIGDARIKLRDAPDHRYDLIIADAFSSESIPTHLLTKEAIAGYLAKLAPDGVLALQITNRFLDLETTVGNLARDASLIGRINRYTREDRPNENDILPMPVTIVLLARREEILGSIATNPRWKPLLSNPEARVWSDDYVNILSVL